MFVLASPTFWRLEGLSRVLRLPNGGYILTIVLIYILRLPFAEVQVLVGSALLCFGFMFLQEHFLLRFNKFRQ